MAPHEIIAAPGEQIAAILRQMYLRSARLLDGRLADHGTTLARAKLLFLLTREGALRSADLATCFGYAPRTVTEAIDGLERDGLVRRTQDPTDRRAKRISLTDAGAIVARESEKTRKHFIGEVFQILDDQEVEDMISYLRRINLRIDEIET